MYGAQFGKEFQMEFMPESRRSAETLELQPVVGLFNASEETFKMVERMLVATSIQCLVCHFADLQKGQLDFTNYLATHNPAVVIFNISPPYDENWEFFRTMRDSRLMEGCAVVLMTSN